MRPSGGSNWRGRSRRRSMPRSASADLTTLVTVTGQYPTVDVHSARREITLGGDLVKSIPTVRSYNALVVLVPGVVTAANDTVTGTATTAFPMHGGRVNEGRLQLDGLNVGSPPSGNSAASYVVDVGSAQEVTFSSGPSGESETAGLVMNIVPKPGGNTTRASLFASGTGEQLQSDNLTPSLKSQGFVAPTPLTKVYDFSATIGGPIVKDRIWYTAHAQTGGSTKVSGNVYYNLNAGEPTEWLYAPDLDRPAYSDRTFENASARVTWQLTPRNKVGGFWDAQALCRNCTGATPGNAEPARISPEAVGVLGRPLHVTQATWSSPVTNRLLARSGIRRHVLRCGQLRAHPESHARSDSRGRAVRERLRGKRRHSRAGLPIAGLQRRPHGLVPVEGVGVVRHRRSQPEDRLSAHADDRRSHVDDEQPEPHVSRQQRRAESADPVDLAVGERRARRVAGAVCPATMDATVV